jgi:hypothetical protein
MSANNAFGTIFIKDHTVLPAGLALESEPFLPSWRAVRNFDGYLLGRKIQEAGWNFFYLAGDISAIAFGRGEAGNLRKAVKRALARQGGSQFNSLEITKAVSRSFLGVPFTRITVHYRHIQQGIVLKLAKDADSRIASDAVGKVAERKHTTLVASS